jgi:adenylosuccinate lyase
MGRIWTDENKYRLWLAVEIAVCEALAARGTIPKSALATIKRRAGFNTHEIDQIEARVKHDVIAFLTSVARRVGPDSRFIHLGLTSSDVVDTALALQLVEAADLLIDGIGHLQKALRRRAIEHEKTIMIGRTHGIHAEPITFGLKLALWYAEMGRNRVRLERARETVGVGKLSGAVGTFAHLDPAVEADVCRRLHLAPEPIANQVIQRDRHAEFVAALAIVGSSLDKFATEIRNLQRTDVREVEEPFAKGQKGSSSMPHKRNPVGCEQVSGLARLLRSNAQAAFENVPLWHERDISHSSVERVILPDSTILLDYTLNRMTAIVGGLLVYPKRMRENLERMKGLVYSQTLLLALARAGMTREMAYEAVQRASMRVWEGKGSFLQMVLEERGVVSALGAPGVRACFDPARHIRHVPLLFRRVFGKAHSPGKSQGKARGSKVTGSRRKTKGGASRSGATGRKPSGARKTIRARSAIAARRGAAAHRRG